MRTYKNADGTFTLVNNGMGIGTFDSEEEAATMTRKLEFATAVRAKVTEFDNLVSYLDELRDIFQDSGYAVGGDNPITDVDLEALGMMAADLAAFNAFVENIDLFYHNGTPAKVDYAAAVNRFRSM